MHTTIATVPPALATSPCNAWERGCTLGESALTVETRLLTTQVKGGDEGPPQLGGWRIWGQERDAEARDVPAETLGTH